MTPTSRLSMQQINPLGSSGNWEAAVILGLATWSYVVLSAVVGFSRVSHPGQMVLAVVLVTIALVINTVAAAPQRRDYRRYDFVLVLGLALGAALLQGAASAGGLASISTDWGPLALAGLLAAASPFRPPLELLRAGFSAAVIVAIQKTIEGLTVELPYGLVYFVVMAIAPIVIVTVGQGAYAGYVIRSLTVWRRRFPQTQEQPSSLRAIGTAGTVAQGLLVEFGADVQPLLTRILRTGRITASDITVAASATERIRARLVSISSQTWLERLNVQAIDDDATTEKFDIPSRAVITALVTGMTAQGLTHIAVHVTSLADGGRIQVHVSAQHSESRFALRAKLSPIFRVLYVVFSNVIAVYGTGTLTVQFDYGVESGEDRTGATTFENWDSR